jgi:RHS repeat-associated protein
VNAGLPLMLEDDSRRYVWGQGLVYATDLAGTVQAVYHSDGLGSVRALTDAAGTVVQTYQTDETDEFGVPTAAQGGSSQPFGYAGEHRDGGTGLIYLRARMYDPVIGRFLQRDPIAGKLRTPLSLNRYSYVRNNPTSLVDPSGLYEYRYEWHIGSRGIVGSPESVMAYFQQHPRDIFPFNLGECYTIEFDATCVLNAGPGPASYAPVKIVSTTSTSFTFLALEGHFDYNPKDPTGAWIAFSIVQRDEQVYLQQKARALVENPALDFIAPIFARSTWAQQAINLRRIFNPTWPAERPAEPMP